MNRVRVGFFSLSASLGQDEDRSYLEWHQLDHMPEQYQLPGLLHGQRWMSTAACRRLRLAPGTGWDRVDHAVLYLMGEPVEETLDQFMRLGAALREAGRYPVALPSVFAGTARFVEGLAAPAALVSDEVVPWRPNRGIYLMVEEGGAPPGPDLLGLPGVAGVWSFRTEPQLRRWQATSGDYRFTVVYLDRDPAEVAPRLGEVVTGGRAEEDRGLLLASAFEALTPWAWRPMSEVLPG